MSMCFTLCERHSASAMAFITAGVEPIEPASPAPFNPIGLVLEGMLRVWKSKFGKSSARGIQLVGGELLHRSGELGGGAADHHSADRNRARAAGAVAGRNRAGVALEDADALQRHVELLGDDLRIGGLVALPG